MPRPQSAFGTSPPGQRRITQRARNSGGSCVILSFTPGGEAAKPASRPGIPPSCGRAPRLHLPLPETLSMPSHACVLLTTYYLLLLQPSGWCVSCGQSAKIVTDYYSSKHTSSNRLGSEEMLIGKNPFADSSTPSCWQLAWQALPCLLGRTRAIRAGVRWPNFETQSTDAPWSQ